MKFEKKKKKKKTFQVNWHEELLHHDNFRPHTAQVTHERIPELQWELFEHGMIGNVTIYLSMAV
jgi:hypothetical protein